MAGQGQVLAEMGGGWMQCVDEQGMYYYNEFTQQSTEVWPPPAMAAMPAQVGYAPQMAPQQFVQPAQQYEYAQPAQQYEYAQPAQAMQFMQQPAPQAQFMQQPAPMQAAFPAAQMMMPPQSMMQQPMQMQPQTMMPQAQPMMQQPLPQMSLASVPSMVVMPSAGMAGMPQFQNNFPQAASMVATGNMGQPVPSGATKQVDPEAQLASSVVTRDLTNAAKSAVAVKSKKVTKKKKSGGWSCC